MPGFDYIFVKPLHTNDISFESDKHIANIDIPILILHATDDPVIPYFLGRKVNMCEILSENKKTNWMELVASLSLHFFISSLQLHTIARNIRSNNAKPIYFKGFGDGFGHKFIYRSPELPQLIKDFVQCSITDHWPCPGFNKTDAADVLEQ